MFIIGLFTIGFFFYPIMLRKLLLPEIVTPFNFFYLAIEVLLLIKYYGKIKKSRIIYVLVLVLMSIIQFISNIRSHSFVFSLCAFICIVLPIYMINVDLKGIITYKYAQKILKIFNIVILVIVITGVLNVISNGFIADTFWTLISGNDNANRLWSIYGHPLFNTYLFITYYVFNYYNNKYGRGIVSNWFCMSVAMVGVLLTASRLGIVLIFTLFVISNYKSIKMTIMEILIFGITYYAGLFNLLIERLTTISITNGRIDTYIYLMNQTYFVSYKLFFGYGTGYAFNVYSGYLSWASSAYEFPFLSYLLEYGYIFTILYYVLTLIIPCITILRRKQWHLLICLLIIQLQMNSFNAIALASDYQFVYMITILIILAISSSINNKAGRIHR